MCYNPSFGKWHCIDLVCCITLTPFKQLFGVTLHTCICWEHQCEWHQALVLLCTHTAFVWEGQIVLCWCITWSTWQWHSEIPGVVSVWRVLYMCTASIWNLPLLICALPTSQCTNISHKLLIDTGVIEHGKISADFLNGSRLECPNGVQFRQMLHMWGGACHLPLLTCAPAASLYIRYPKWMPEWAFYFIQYWKSDNSPTSGKLQLTSKAHLKTQTHF